LDSIIASSAIPLNFWLGFGLLRDFPTCEHSDAWEFGHLRLSIQISDDQLSSNTKWNGLVWNLLLAIPECSNHHSNKHAIFIANAPYGIHQLFTF
jgi:hypothetical protein